MMRPSSVVSLVLASLFGSALSAQSTLTPVSTFGTNGWLAPGSTPYLAITNNERGLAYNPITGNLILVSRTGGTNIRILNSFTGTDLGNLDVTGITGGTFVVNQVDCAEDGSIYVCNLSTSVPAPFKVYKWASEAAGVPPTVAYNATTNMVRTGDSFAVYGGFAIPAQFAAAGSSNASNSCFSVGPLDGTNASTTYLSIPGTPNSTSNGYRLGMTFANANTIIGTQGAAGLMTSFSGATATLQASIPLSAAQRPMDYAVIAGTPVLAVADTNSSIVSIYDISNPAVPVLLASGTNTVAPLSPNANGTGAVQWGQILGNTATLYVMCSNQGIQAFNVTIQVPASARQFGVGCGSPALSLASSGAPIIPSGITLDLTNIPVTGLAFFVLGFAPIPGGFPLPIAPGCNQYLFPDSTSLVFPSVPGTAQFPLNVPNNPGFAGVEFYSQGVSFDTVSGGIQSSNGLRLYLQTF